MYLFLVFLSGFAGLVYEVLWMKQLGLLFGNSSHAAAATLAAFFGGLAAGSWYWGRRSSALKNPLRTYARLELGIAVTALLYFAILACYYAVYPSVYQFISSRSVLLLVKFVLALILVFPPAFCMGGTIPVIGQHLIRKRSAFGTTSALLYGTNTFGAALGALLAGFYFPLWLGYRITCFSAMSISVLVAAIAFVLSHRAAAVGCDAGDEPVADVSRAGPIAVSPPRKAKGKAKSKSARNLALARENLRLQKESAAIGPALDEGAEEEVAPGGSVGVWPATVVCFLSGFGVLALEVLWTRMFAQVLENSVYTFAAILVIVLVCMAFGALISSGLARLPIPPVYLLALLILLGGTAAALMPFVFMQLTDSLQILTSTGSWSDYVLLIFGNGFLAVGPPALLLGTVFPYLMKVEESNLGDGETSIETTGGLLRGGSGDAGTPAGARSRDLEPCIGAGSGEAPGSLSADFSPLPGEPRQREKPAISAGRSLGRLAAVNTVGAILGSLLCGFVLLGWLGMWRTAQLIALLYPAVILALPVGWRAAGLILRGSAVVLLVLLLTLLNPSGLRKNSVDRMRHAETILRTWEGSDCTVAVAESVHGLSIKINSHYGLGSTGAFPQERLQADLPLMVWPETESIFFLGMGTGITAGAALDPQFENVKRVVACELVADVVEAARLYMTDVDGFDVTGGLFTDRRASIVIEDGRHFLMATRERFDMINADLFVPFRSGAGNLYTKEHFRSVRERLNPGGIFVQWVPLYQVTENEFGIIARTMLSEFDQVSLWRNNFQPGDEVIAFVGHSDSAPLPASDIDSRADKLAAVMGRSHDDLRSLALPFNAQTILLFYCGNLTAARDLFKEYPINCDDRPLIEYMAPRTYRSQGDSPIPWFIGPRIARLIDDIQAICPLESDPLLVNRTAGNRRLPAAGVAFHWARIAEVIGDGEACRNAWWEFIEEWTDQ